MSAPRVSDDFPRQDLAFVEELIGRTVLSEKQAAAITQQLKRVQARAGSETLHLAVLGEFNSGKSTFINALLRTPLLKSANQATTAAATLIHFGDEFSLKVEFNDGASVSAAGANCALLSNKVSSLAQAVPEGTTIHQLLDLVTVEPSVAAHVRQVEIALPAEALDRRLCIIDTPGIGAGVDYARSHDAVTERVAADIADAAVVLIPADNPMTRTLTSFLTETASRFLHRCVFVITKMDHIQESDRASLREFVASRLVQIAGSRPLVLEAAAATMLPVKQFPAHLQEPWAYWQADFRNMEESIHQALARSRTVMITEHLAALLQSLLVELETTISTRRVDLEAEQRALEKNSVVELERVLSSLFEKCRREIEEEVEDCKAKTRRQAQEFESQAKQAARELLDRAIMSSLEKVLDREIPAAINRQQAEFDNATDDYLTSLRGRCESVQRLFVEQFETSYQNLRALGLKIQVPPFASVSGTLAKGHFKSAKSFVAGSQRWRVGTGIVTMGCFASFPGAAIGLVLGLIIGASSGFGSAIVGALLGCFVGFGISAMLGGYAGAKIGKNMGNISKHRREVLSRMLPDITAHVENTRAARLGDFDRAKGDVLRALDDGVKTHTQAYTGAVNRMIEEHQEKMSRLAAEARQVEIDSAELRRRSERLEERRQQYRTATF
ncbi:MAG TPA: dynamin family protein [Bryobacteraceae bacterium]|nr:dynamin family protein [Bryobacteraceae bacterium]